MHPVEVLGVSVMNEAWMLTFAAFVPFLALGLVMWLARLEDTLGDGLESPKATREAAAAVATATAATAPAATSPEKAPATAVV
jgi:uncharacterized iron-regulated membrane protein